MIDQHDYTSNLMKWVIEHWVILGTTVSTIIGGIAYVLHQRFATIEALEHCRRQTVNEFHTALDEQKIHMMAVNQQAHDSLKETITIILDRVDDVDEKLDNLKNSLLHREWFK